LVLELRSISRHWRLSFARLWASCLLFALYVQGALPRREPETFAEAFERRRPG
jgi:hypothetical protein